PRCRSAAIRSSRTSGSGPMLYCAASRGRSSPPLKTRCGYLFAGSALRPLLPTELEEFWENANHPCARAGLTPTLTRGIPSGLGDRDLARSAQRTPPTSHPRAADRETRTTPCAPLVESRSSLQCGSARGEPC